MVSVPLLTERMGVNYFEENLLELYLQVMAQGCNMIATPAFLVFFLHICDSLAVV